MNDSVYKSEVDVGIEPSMTDKWQMVLDLISGLFGFPVTLVMHALPGELEVMIRGKGAENPFPAGHKVKLGSGLYCDKVVETRQELSISNALKDQKWAHSMGVQYGFIAYMGFPILWPNGDLFGTICVMDKQEHAFSEHETGFLRLAAITFADSLKALLDRKQLNRDIERQKYTAAALRESEERFRKIFELSPTAVMITAASDGRFLDANEACLKLFGVQNQEILGKTVTEFPMYGDPSERQIVLKMLDENKKIRNYISYKKNRQGNRLELNVSVDRIMIGDEMCLIATLNDLTDQKKLEHELLAANERLTLATGAADIGIWDLDIKNNSLEWDDNLVRLYQHKGDNTTNYQAWHNRVHPDDIKRCEQELNASLNNDVPYRTQFRIKLPDGEVRHIQAYGRVMRDNFGLPVRMLGVNYDITDKVSAQAQLEDSEMRLRRAQQMARVGNWEYDPQKRRFWASEEGLSMYGIGYDIPYKDASIIQGAVFREDRAMMDAAMESLLDKDTPYDVQFRIRRQDNGEVRVLHSVAELSTDIADGNPIVKGVVQDISEYVHAEQKLLASETRYWNLFHNNAAVQIIIDSDSGSIYDANNAACIYYGLTLEEIRSRKVWDINPAGESFVRDAMSVALGGGTHHLITGHIRWDGEVRDVEVYIGRVDLEGRRLLHAIVHDITERKLAEKALAESEQRFRLFVENAPDGVFVQTQGQFAYVNRKTVEMFKASSEDNLLGRSVAESFDVEFQEAVKDRIRTLNVEGQSVPLKEETILRIDGSLLDVEVSAVPFRYQGEDGALVFMRDISERRQMGKEKESMVAQLQQKQKLEAIGTLAGGVAHEINNPVTGIINYAQLISESPTADQEIHEFSGEIIHEGRRIAEIVSSLLTFARQEKKTHSLAQISDIVMGTLSLTRTILRHDQITLEVNIPEDLPSVKCRNQQIQQVLMNLITNARDALNEKYQGYNEDKRITITCEAIEKEGLPWLRMAVEDRGTGMSADVQSKMFDPFFTTKPRGVGTGLGLSISHGIVREHRGELYFETEPGEFTRAVMELPADNGWDLNKEGANDG